MSINDDLTAELNAAPVPDEPRFRPYSEFDGSNGFIQTGATTRNITSDAYDDILRENEYDPRDVMIAGVPRISRWQRWDGEWLRAYRFNIMPRIASFSDLEALILRVKSKPKESTGAHWFVFQAGDQQIGKRSKDGSTDQIIERYVDSIQVAKQKFKELKRFGIDGIQISMPGDCLEGNMSQGGKNVWLTKEPITEQVRILRRLMYHTVEEFSPLVDRVYLDVVNGNHDEAQRDQQTYPGNGWATECAIAVSDGIELNPMAFGHVTVRVPDKWCGMMTVPVGNTIVAVVHGHQWRRQGSMNWLAQQAVNHQSAGGAHVVQHGHWHEFMVRSNEHKFVIGSPTYDCGSDWLRNKQGSTSQRGGLVYLLNSGKVSHLQVV